MGKAERRRATGGRSLLLQRRNRRAKDREAEQERGGKDCKNRRNLGRAYLTLAERANQADMAIARGGRMEGLVSDVVYREQGASQQQNRQRRTEGGFGAGPSRFELHAR